MKLRPIPTNFTHVESMEVQRNAHCNAIQYLKTSLGDENVHIVSSAKPPEPNPTNRNIDPSLLDSSVFGWMITRGVQEDILQSSNMVDTAASTVYMYSAASQYNGAEAPGCFTVRPGQAVKIYKRDRTQGPQAQLAFPDKQVETINNSANLGFNSLVNVLDENTKDCVCNGYLKSFHGNLLHQLRTCGNKMQFICVRNIPKESTTGMPVYMILVSAPCIPPYIDEEEEDEDQYKELQYLCAYFSFRAQFHACICLAKENPGKQIVFKATTPGLGVFHNDPQSVAEGFYHAALDFQSLLRHHNVRIFIQVFHGRGDAREFVDILGLQIGRAHV